MPPRIRRLATSAVAFLALASTGTVLSGILHAGASTRTRPAPPPSQGPGALTLVNPPSFVTPSQPFLAKLAISSALSRSSLDLDVTVYSRLLYRSAFDETLNGTPVGEPISSSPPLSVASLPAEPSGAVDLTVPVDAAGQTTPGNGPFIADLECTLGACTGVYPVLIQLSQTNSSSPISQLLTYLVYTYPPDDTEPVRFALVVPVSQTSSAASSAGGAGRMRPSAISAVSSIAAALSEPATARVPLTLAPDPSTVSELAQELTPRSEQALRSLSALAVSSGRQTLCGPFAQVDPSQLVAAGLTRELSYEVHEGASTLESDLRVVCPTGGTWWSQYTLDQSALGALGALGYQNVVVPQSAVAGPAPSSTWTQLLNIGDSPSDSLLAKTVDPGLSAQLRPASETDPALAADQVLADLEFVYYEYPATPDPRGVVAVAPTSWSSEVPFVVDFLTGLESNPMVRPVTVGDIFSEVPVGGTEGTPPSEPVGQPSDRRPAAAGTTGLPASAIRTARARLQGFSSAVSPSAAGAAEVQELDQLLLDAESSALTTEEQDRAVAGASAALTRQLHSLSVNAGEIRLTSNAARVPITVVNDLPYPVTGVLSVTSDKLVFPSHSQTSESFCRPPVVHSTAGRSTFSLLCVSDHPTNVVYVDMRARASGDFRISVSLTSPDDSLVLASGQLTVRSMSTSAVAIALSVIAVLVLLAWWGRSFVRGRRGGRARRPAHARGARTST